MHNPSMLTPVLANEAIAEQTLAARKRRSIQREGTLFGRFRRRSDHGSRPLVPRGRMSPPLAH
jgi:hypothetical protein